MKLVYLHIRRLRPYRKATIYKKRSQTCADYMSYETQSQSRHPYARAPFQLRLTGTNTHAFVGHFSLKTALDLIHTGILTHSIHACRTLVRGQEVTHQVVGEGGAVGAHGARTHTMHNLSICKVLWHNMHTQTKEQQSRSHQAAMFHNSRDANHFNILSGRIGLRIREVSIKCVQFNGSSQSKNQGGIEICAAIHTKIIQLSRSLPEK